jgi:hypothetical protein
MLENDYLMRMILLFVRFLQQSLGQRHKDPRQAAQDLEQQIADVVDIDPGLFFSLTPESMVLLLQLGDFDSRLAEFMVRAMALEAGMLDEAGMVQGAELRRSQLSALIESYSLDIGPSDLTPEAIEAFAQAAAQAESGRAAANTPGA